MPNMNLKKLWRRKSVDITDYDPTYKVIYLGNVLTGWAKGEGCVEKPLATLWRNYCQSSRPDISMKVTICGAGLQAVTEEHGLTEYWAHRITYCTAHRAYPRVFCWVYRHEGRRLKQELRCHAVLCPKQAKAEAMSAQLKERLALALHDFRREKAIRQNARLSIVNAVYSLGSLPRRKRYLVIGSSNYRPPLERSKSAPKLGAIEEIVEEEEEEEIEKEGREEAGQRVNRKTPLTMSTSSHLDTLLSQLRNSNYSPTVSSSADVSPSEVAYVYQQVEDTAVGVTLPAERVTFSTPDLLFYHGHSPERTPSSPENRVETTQPIPNPLLPTLEIPLKTPSPSPSPSPDDLGLLESFKEKLGLSNGEESLTSDRTESIGSHSCSSSCGSGDETLLLIEVGGKRSLGEERKESGKGVGDEDNISEESGYSEDKECFPLRV